MIVPTQNDKKIIKKRTMDGETPSWLEEGESAALPPPVTPPPKPVASDATATATGASRDAPVIDNVSGSILASITASRNKSDVPAAAAATTTEAGDKEELSKLIVFMRALNMAAATLLITVSVSRSQCH
jgi:hypothetical protein